ALTRAPEICIEVVSPSNSVKELSEKREAYFAAGAQEVWIVFPQSKRCEFYDKQGSIARSAYTVDLSDVFKYSAPPCSKILKSSKRRYRARRWASATAPFAKTRVTRTYREK